MELKWLEDFICVAEKGHFAQAADIRFVTQSALSRRIQSLELWIGTPLFDRSEHPIKLTAAGREFIKTARHIVDQSYEAREIANEYSKIGDNSIKISCLHTLALKFIPNLISDLHQQAGPFCSHYCRGCAYCRRISELALYGSMRLFHQLRSRIHSI